jgi:transcriptional antiterminator NusG
MKKRWYAVNAISGHENKVRESIINRAKLEGLWEQEIFQILIPTQRELTTRAGKRVEVDKKVFPGYVLVQMVMTEDSYRLIRGTSSVTGFITSGNQPVPIGDSEISLIMKKLESSQEVAKMSWEPGDIVRVVEGPFSDYNGKVEEVDEQREKLRVLINIFGRDTPVELDYTQVEKI